MYMSYPLGSVNSSWHSTTFSESFSALNNQRPFYLWIQFFHSPQGNFLLFYFWNNCLTLFYLLDLKVPIIFMLAHLGLFSVSIIYLLVALATLFCFLCLQLWVSWAFSLWHWFAFKPYLFFSPLVDFLKSYWHYFGPHIISIVLRSPVVLFYYRIFEVRKRNGYSC